MVKRHAYPDVQRQRTLEDLDNSSTLFAEQDPRSVVEVISPAFVSFEDRRLALEAIAKIYSINARAEGLSRAASSIDYRPELESRIDDPDKLVHNTEIKAKRLLGKNSLGFHLSILTKEEAMLEVGAHSAKAANARQATIRSVYESFGPEVGAKKRKARLKQVR